MFNDLNDIEEQLLAIDEWLGVLEERCHLYHHGLCTKELAQARARMHACRLQLGAQKAELCKLTQN